MRQLVVSLVGLLLLSTPFYVSAQRNTVTGAMIIHNTDVIKSKRAKRQYAVTDIKKGYQQEGSIAYSFLACWDVIHQLNINYVGGYRFNHYLYAGIGTGLDFAASYNYKPMVLANDDSILDSRYYGVGDSFYGYLVDEEILPVQKLSIPLYGHIRAYFMNTKWAPFLAFSAGMRLSASKKLDIHEKESSYGWSYSHYKIGDYVETQKYGAVTAMFEVMPGVSYQRNNNLGFNFQFGYATRSGHAWDYDGICREWHHGFTMRLGVVF